MSTVGFILLMGFMVLATLFIIKVVGDTYKLITDILVWIWKVLTYPFRRKQ